jgi:uncharacterized protein YkwD
MTLRLLLPLGALLLSASAAPVRTPLERAVLDEINFARANPQAYAERLKTYRTYFEGKIVRYPGNPNGLITSEGVSAVDEAIAFLRKQQSLPPIAHSDLLALAAADHAAEQGPRGATGHESADGSRPGARVTRRGGGIYVAETITYGPPSGTEVVRQLIIDDGVRSRGHRRIVFSPEYRFAGAGCGVHKTYRVMCVVDFGSTADGQP